jgi:hypothetical protein
MIDILLFLFLFCLGYAFGWTRANKFILDRLADDPEFIKNIIEKHNNNNKIEKIDITREIQVQKERGIFYVYDKENGEFLAQGGTFDSALENVTKRFPNQKFSGHISKEEAEKMGINKQN